MKEINKLEFFKKNKIETDYIKVYDRSLQREKIIPVFEALVSDIKLSEYLDGLTTDINTLNNNFNLLQKENKELKELLNKIWEGLNARWKRL